MTHTLISRSCPLCNSTTSELYAKSNIRFEDLDTFSFASRKYPEGMHYDLRLCNACDMIYSDNVLPNSIVSDQYEQASYDSGLEACYAAKTYASYLPANIRKGSALDIGTGSGDFLEFMKDKGFAQVEGVEPSLAAIEAATPTIKPYIKKGLFNAANHTPASYDLISCFQTLEHVENPLQLSKDIYGLLKPGGAYFTITHNFRGLVNRIMGLGSPIRDIEHYQLFSEQSLYRLMELVGFRNVKIFSIWNTYPLYYWMKLLPIPQKAAATLVSLSKTLKVGYIPIPLNVGNVGAIGFK